MSAALKKQVFDFKTQYGLALDDTDGSDRASQRPMEGAAAPGGGGMNTDRLMDLLSTTLRTANA